MSTLPVTDSETSLKKDQFYSLLAKERGKGYRPIPIFLGTFTDGTRYMVLDQTQSPVYYLITDLVQQNVELYDSSGNGIPSATSLPAIGARGLVVRLPNQQVVGITGTVSISAANNLPMFQRGTYSGGPLYGQVTLGVGATSIYAMGAGSSGIIVRALTANAGDVFLGDSSVSTLNGCPLSPGRGIPIPAPSIGGTTVYGVSSNGTDTVGYIAY
jgi:hypothetical protein